MRTSVRTVIALKMTLAAIVLVGLYKLSVWRAGSMSHISATLTEDNKRKCGRFPGIAWHLLNRRVNVLSNIQTCADNPKILLVVLVTSHAKHASLRRQIRENSPTSELESLQMRRLFLIGESPEFPSQSLCEEQKAHEDLIIGDFQESYKNLTYKHMMGLKWVQEFCSNAELVLKQDDDVLVDYYQIHVLWRTEISRTAVSWQFQQLLFRSLEHSGFIVGKPMINMKVIRKKDSKWFVAPEEYPEEVYPAFVSGWAYLTSVHATKSLLAASREDEYFWIDDAYITGTLRERANVTILDFSSVFTHYKGHILCCLDIRTKHKQWCDFIVGPTNSDSELVPAYFKHARSCYQSGSCKWRSVKTQLNRFCVVTDSSLRLTNDVPRKTGMAAWRQISL